MHGKILKIALRTALIYGVVGSLWIFFSDRLVPLITTNLAVVTELDSFKGIFFILVTAVLLYFGLSRQLRRWEKEAAARQRAEDEIKYILDNTHDVIFQIDLQGNYIYGNVAAERLTGYPLSQLLQMSMWQLVPPDHHQQLKERLQKRITGETMESSFEFEIRHHDGHRVWVELTTSGVFDVTGKLTAIQGVARDISDRKRVEQALMENTRILDHAQAVAKTGSWHLDIATQKVKWSAETYRIFEVHAGQKLNLESLRDCIHPLDQENVEAAWEAALHGAPFDVEHRIIVNGTTKWVRERAEVSFDSQGNAIRCVGTVQDITEQRQAEAESRLVNFAINHVKEEVFMVDKHGRILFVNDEASRQLGYTREELLKMSVADIDPDYPTDSWPLHWQELKDSGSLSFESRHRCKSGRIFPVQVLANYFTHDGQGYNLGLVRDISEKRQAEEKFAREQARFKLIFDTIPIGIAFHTVHPDGSFNRIINDAHLKICGLNRADHDKPDIYLQITHPDDRGPQQQWKEKILTGEIKQFSMEKRYVRLDGQTVWVTFSYQREAYPDGTVEELTTVVNITERKQAEEQLRKLSRAVEYSPASIVITNPAGNIEYVNPKFVTMTGYSLDEVRGKNPRILKGTETPAEEYQRLWHVITSGREWRGVFHNRKKNGEMFWESASISPITDKSGRITHFLAVKEDITHDKLLEEQFRQMQKMEAIGRLAGGVAHDFNNILAVILMQAELLGQDKTLASAQREFTQEISKAAQRGANLTRQLLLFGRKQVIQPRELDLNEVVTNLAKMLQRILGEDIQMQFKFATQRLMLRADAGMLDQVLMNLAVNSRDAMPKGGKLLLETAAVEFDEQTSTQSPQARSGQFTRLSVTDTGVGISPERLPLIFEPFFTTKEVGKGTGLGLATVFSIVQQHKGWIDVQSEVDKGTTFHIYLPRPTRAKSNNAARPVFSNLRGGDETILLVEDEPALRSLMHKILTQLGYRVLEAPGSTVALELWERHAKEIHLLLTDLVLPDGMNGKELAQHLQRQKPALKVLYASGYSADVMGRDFHILDSVNFLAKPFHAHKLAQCVRNRLDTMEASN